MQQVFGLVNKLLKSDAETTKRKLSVVTYKASPNCETETQPVY